MVYASDLKSDALGIEGSTPSTPTTSLSYFVRKASLNEKAAIYEKIMKDVIEEQLKLLRKAGK